VLKAWSIFNGILTGSMALLNLSLLPVIATIIAVASTIYLLYQGYKKIMSIINKDKKEENKINTNQGAMQPNNIENSTDDSLSKLFNLSKSMATNNAPPKGEINVKVEAINNAKAESTILKQSGLKLGVQQ
jgi:predicted DNA repair protein MutK